MSSAVLIKTASFTTPDITIGDVVYLCDATSGELEVLLSKNMKHGQRLVIKKIDNSGNAIRVISENPLATIDGDAYKLIGSQYSSMQIVCQNESWWIV